MPVSGRTRVAGVIGWPVEHSRSPALHNAAYAAAGLDAIYVPLPVPPGRVGEALAGLRALGFMGANVTVPHKQAAFEACDALDEAARATGAVNTVVIWSDGALSGHNTDVGGFQDALDEATPEAAATAGARAIVLGSGGAARAVVLALRERGYATSVIARDVKRGLPLLSLGATEVLAWTPRALAAALDGALLLCDATSAALDADGERTLPSPIPLDRLAADALVISLVYHRRPALLEEAAARGRRTLDGGPMLVHQAARAFTLMTGVAAPLDAMRAALAASLAPENANAPR